MRRDGVFPSVVQKVVRALSRQELRSGWVVTSALFASFCVYRGVLWWRLATLQAVPFGFVLERFWVHELVAASGWDLFASALLTLPFWWVADLWPRFSRSFGYFLAAALWSAALAFLSAVHLRMMFDRGEGLGVAVLKEAIGGAMTLDEAWSYGEGLDYLICAAPFAFVFFGAWAGHRLSESSWRRGVSAVPWALACFFVCALLPEHRRFPNRIHHNPILYGASEIGRESARGERKIFKNVQPVSQKQRRTLAHVDAEFVEISAREVPPRPGELDASGPLNVLFIVMESTGSRYALRPTPDGSVAMPYLKSLKEQGWWMDNHYSTANSSHRSLFSLFSGLYPSFGSAYFCITPKVRIPTLSSFLPLKYERFLRTPGELRSYFPRSLLEHSGFSDLQGRAEMVFESPRPGPETAHNEFDVLGRFFERLDEAKGPFFGVYYSYTPHFHYFDHGPEYRVMSDLKDPLHRYMNSLRTLDRVLEMLMSGLRERELLERTVIVVVGDHGEAFGEHGLSTHGNDSHEEAIRTPWLLLFPGSRSRVVREPTSHVDVLPTLLDTLRIPYEPLLFQGESLWRKERRRRYIFEVGNEQSFAAVDQAGHKVLQSSRLDTCGAHSLSVDPGERRVLPCSTFASQSQALTDFRPYQTQIIQEYSAVNAEGRDFHGLRHPGMHPLIP